MKNGVASVKNLVLQYSLSFKGKSTSILLVSIIFKLIVFLMKGMRVCEKF